MAYVVTATPDQVDLFGKASDQLNKAKKVRDDLVKRVFIPSSDNGNTHWAGSHYQITASERRVNRFDLPTLIEKLQERGIEDANALVESCQKDSISVSFRSTVLVGRLALQLAEATS